MKNFTFVFTFIFLLMLAAQAQQNQIQNASFEEWEGVAPFIEPVDWSSIKTSDGTFNDIAPVVWAKSTVAHSGSFSVQLTNTVAFSIVANGIVTNGRVHAEFGAASSYVYTDQADERWKTALTGRPAKFSLWARYTPQGNDTAQIKVLLHKSAGSLPPRFDNQGNRIGYAQVNIFGTVSSWTRYEVPFTYNSPENPEYVLIIASSGASSTPVAGSVVLLDDLALEFPTGINDVVADKGLIYTSGNTIFLDKLTEKNRRNAKIDILSLNGSKIYSSQATSLLVEVNNDKYPEGLYIVHIYGPDFNYTQKVYLK